MAWLYNGTVIKAGQSWVGSVTDEDGNSFNVKHPKNWMIWSDEDKVNNGLVWQDDVSITIPDRRFYWSEGIERSLTDINIVDADGNAVIDPITGVQKVQLGLKSQWIAQTKTTANEKLKVHDWYVVRNAEKSVAIPADITTYRDAVRTAASTIETAINACSTLDDFKALFVVPMDDQDPPQPTGKPPIYNFPDEVN